MIEKSILYLILVNILMKYQFNRYYKQSFILHLEHKEECIGLIVIYFLAFLCEYFAG